MTLVGKELKKMLFCLLADLQIRLGNFKFNFVIVQTKRILWVLKGTI